jgi:hypothetical protein
MCRCSRHVLVRWLVVGIVDNIVRVLSVVKRDFGVADEAEMIYTHAHLLGKSKKVERTLRALKWRRNVFGRRSLQRGDSRGAQFPHRDRRGVRS